MPAVRAALGFAPTARNRKPTVERSMSHHTATAATSATRKPACRRNCGPSRCGYSAVSAIGGEIDYNQVNVTFTPSNGVPTTVFQDNAPCDGGSNGWQYNADKTKIVLCGDSCAKAKADSAGKISIALGCATQVAQ